MLTQRDRGWSSVRESLRRQRNVHDLVHQSGSTRLHHRTSIAGKEDVGWPHQERLIVEAERTLKSLDPHSLDFWTKYRRCEQTLIDLYRDAGVEFGS